jgi:hypothetical protein
MVRHFDGSVTEATLADLPDYTSEVKNPNNQRNVEVVDIELPFLKPYAGLRLVDTPDWEVFLPIINRLRKTGSRSWCCPDGRQFRPPLSENDLELIRELTHYTPNILLLLTKTDLLSTEQQDEVVAFFRQTLQRELNRSFPFISIPRESTRNSIGNVSREKYYRVYRATGTVNFGASSVQDKSLLRSTLDYLDIALQTALQAIRTGGTTGADPQ